MALEFISVVGFPLTNLENDVEWKARRVLRMFGLSCAEFGITNSSEIHLYPYGRDIDTLEFPEQRELLVDLIQFIQQDQNNELIIMVRNNPIMAEPVVYIRHIPSDTLFVDKKQNIILTSTLNSKISIINNFIDYCNNKMTPYLYSSVVTLNKLVGLLVVELDLEV